jgi:hypothetical protein
MRRWRACLFGYAPDPERCKATAGFDAMPDARVEYNGAERLVARDANRER